MTLETVTENYFDSEDNCVNILHKKSNINFNICGDFSIYWFKTWIDKWEQYTFHILNHYAPRYGRSALVSIDDCKRNVYIDIGSWIGPTVLYAANFYKRVIALEPDPVALERLKQNISVNNYRNITVMDKALSNINDKIKFGGNGELGNSESTMLVNNSQYITGDWGDRWTSAERSQNIIEVDGITIDRLVEEQKIDPATIALVKMDIEGGEFILIPELINFLFEHDIPLYISLHYVFLKDYHIKFILKILFNTYRDCYVFNDNGKKTRVSENQAIEECLTTLVFENVRKESSPRCCRCSESIIQKPITCYEFLCACILCRGAPTTDH